MHKEYMRNYYLKNKEEIRRKAGIKKAFKTNKRHILGLPAPARSPGSLIYYQNNKERIKESNKRWALNNPEKVRMYAEKKRESNRELSRSWARRNANNLKAKRYNTTTDIISELLSRGCEVCGSTYQLCIDHCHDTGQVRGCLCRLCNTSLGKMQESPDLLIKLSQYAIERCVPLKRAS